MGVDNDVLLAKCAQMDRAIKRVEQLLGGDPRRLEDLTVADAVTLNLQRACQCAIDLAHHLVAGLELGVVSTMGESFALLERRAGLERSLAAAMRAMVGFRNIAVHSYDELDPEIVAQVAISGVQDLRRFAAWALARFG